MTKVGHDERSRDSQERGEDEALRFVCIARGYKLSQNTSDKADDDSPENPHHVCLPQVSRSDTDQLMTKRAPAEADAPHLEIGWAFLTANPDVAALRPTPAGTFAVAIPATAPPTPAEWSVPIDTIVPIVFDMAPMLIAVTMLVAMTLMAMAVTGKCGRSNEQGGRNSRKDTKFA
ncbi:MAG: hypothetical protein WAU90_06420 [Methyloceanibacter sp.]